MDIPTRNKARDLSKKCYQTRIEMLIEDSIKEKISLGVFRASVAMTESEFSLVSDELRDKGYKIYVDETRHIYTICWE